MEVKTWEQFAHEITMGRGFTSRHQEIEVWWAYGTYLAELIEVAREKT